MFVLNDATLTQKLREFVEEAHTRGIRVFGAVDQGYDWFVNPFGGPSFASSVQEYNATGNGKLDGILLNIESIPDASRTAYANMLKDFKYGVENAPFNKLELRIGANAGWNDYVFDQLMPVVDSVFCLAYHSVPVGEKDGAYNRAAIELSGGKLKFAAVEIGMETQNKANMAYDPNAKPPVDERPLTYQDNGGKATLESNVDTIFDLMDSDQKQAFAGYGIFYYQAYVDLEDGSLDLPEEEVGSCNILARTSGMGGALLLLLLLGLFAFKRCVNRTHQVA